MPRVASLYLPNLAIDRLRRIEGAKIAAQPDFSFSGVAGSSAQRGWWPPARLPENTKERAKLVALRERLEAEKETPLPEPDMRIEDCSCPRGGGWRPGARWARREQVQAQIDALPPHRRPPIREMGRRSEPAEIPFRKGRGDDACSPPAKPDLSLGSAMPVTNEPLNSPLVTIHRVGNRMEIAAASPDAQALGLHPGMQLTQARAMVSGLDVREADHEGDTALLTRLALFAARRWTPRACISDPTGLFLDLTGVAHLFGGERRMCERLLFFCARLGFSARIAVADTPGAAHALARHGGASIILCAAGRQAKAIAPLPLAALRVDENVLVAARRLGLEQVGDLIAMPRGPLTRRFGKTLLSRLDQALGAAGEAIDPIVPEQPPSAMLRLVEPIATAEAIEQVVRDLLANLAQSLTEEGLGVRKLTLLCARIDGEEQKVSIGTARATRDAIHLARLLCAMIVTIEPGFGIEAMRLVADRCEPLAPQPLEGELGDGRADPDLVPLIDRLAGRLGADRLFRMSAVESDVPERSLRRLPPLAEPACWPHWPRPVRLLSPPERVEKVMAELPDQPPVRFSWRGKMHRVARADGPERIYGEWWKQSGEADAVRDYFQVEDEEGRRFWLYRRGNGESAQTGDMSWWLQGVFG